MIILFREDNKPSFGTVAMLSHSNDIEMLQDVIRPLNTKETTDYLFSVLKLNQPVSTGVLQVFVNQGMDCHAQGEEHYVTDGFLKLSIEQENCEHIKFWLTQKCDPFASSPTHNVLNPVQLAIAQKKVKSFITIMNHATENEEKRNIMINLIRTNQHDFIESIVEHGDNDILPLFQFAELDWVCEDIEKFNNHNSLYLVFEYNLFATSEVKEQFIEKLKQAFAHDQLVAHLLDGTHTYQSLLDWKHLHTEGKRHFVK